MYYVGATTTNVLRSTGFSLAALSLEWGAAIFNMYEACYHCACCQHNVDVIRSAVVHLSTKWNVLRPRTVSGRPCYNHLCVSSEVFRWW